MIVNICNVRHGASVSMPSPNQQKQMMQMCLVLLQNPALLGIKSVLPEQTDLRSVLITAQSAPCCAFSVGLDSCA